MTEKLSNYICKVCSFELWHPISRLSVSHLGLYNDSRFPGRCILVLDDHSTDFSELHQKVSGSFVSDAQEAARVIRLATGAPRINYAILGNHVPHVHFHLIPRGLPSDPIPNLSPWAHPGQKQELDPHEVMRLVTAIRFEMAKTQKIAEANFG